MNLPGQCQAGLDTMKFGIWFKKPTKQYLRQCLNDEALMYRCQIKTLRRQTLSLNIS